MFHVFDILKTYTPKKTSILNFNYKKVEYNIQFQMCNNDLPCVAKNPASLLIIALNAKSVGAHFWWRNFCKMIKLASLITLRELHRENVEGPKLI